MRVLYVLRRSEDVVFQGDIIRQLCKSGCEVVLLLQRLMETPIEHPTLTALSQDESRLSRDWAIDQPNGVVDDVVTCVRKLLTCATFFQMTNQSTWYVDRVRREVPSPLRSLVNCWPMEYILKRPMSRRVLRRVSAFFPADQRIVQQIRSLRPDVVVASPTNVAGSPEYKYVIAARRLGVPSVIPVLSWDTLTTKEALPVVPDVVLVWNRHMFREAVEIHHVPIENIAIIGAFKFDSCFAAKDRLEPRGNFCHRIGLPEDRPFVTYLGSSGIIDKLDEGAAVTDLADKLKRRQINVLYRPHPLVHLRMKDGVTPLPPPRPNLFLQRQDMDTVLTTDSLNNLYNTIQHGLAAVGMSTSAFWECMIFGRPCIAVHDPRYAILQDNVMHFRQLRDSGAIYYAEGVEHCVATVDILRSGQDPLEEQRVEFVKDFIRPLGIDRPAARIAANVVQSVARRLPFFPVAEADTSAAISRHLLEATHVHVRSGNNN